MSDRCLFGFVSVFVFIVGCATGINYERAKWERREREWIERERTRAVIQAAESIQ